MKWIGQHIVDFIARFRSDVYLEDISTGTIASGGNLGLDSNNKIVKADEDGATLTTEAVQDIVGGMFSSNTETRVAATYVDGGDGAGKINIVVDDMTADTTYAIQDGELSQNNFTNDDHTKLDGIEASATADQSNAEIRTAVEAATDSNVFTDADHTKLNGIEASATADQTNDEIKAAVEAASDSNTFTDADHTKLNGIEAGATTDQSQADINGLAITTVGALASGTIADGFGDINNATNTLRTGAATVTSLNCTGAGTFGGGYGSTGATISTAGVGQFNGALNTDSTLGCVAGLTVAGNSSGGGYLRLHEDTDNGTNYITLRAPAALTGDTILLLPDGDGSANQVIKTDGAGNLSWADSVVHEISGTTAGDVGAGAEIVYFGGGTVAAGVIYYYNGTNWVITNANAAATSTGLLGVALDDGTASTVGMCIRGMVNLLTDSSGAAGDALYLFTGSNGVTDNAAPTGNGDIARVIGYCLNADGRRIFFNPDNTFVEVTA